MITRTWFCSWKSPNGAGSFAITRKEWLASPKAAYARATEVARAEAGAPAAITAFNRI